jgi:hypothetical protein
VQSDRFRISKWSKLTKESGKTSRLEQPDKSNNLTPEDSLVCGNTKEEESAGSARFLVTPATCEGNNSKRGPVQQDS